MNKLFQTNKDDITSLVLRVILALVIFPHGLQKLTGAFGGFGFEGSMNYFTDTVGLPWIMGAGVILIESIGMLLLAIGFFTRVIGFILAIIMIGAAATLHENGFFMNWFNNQPGEGIEFFLLAIALAINAVIRGAGKFSVDAWFTRPATQPS